MIEKSCPSWGISNFYIALKITNRSNDYKGRKCGYDMDRLIQVKDLENMETDEMICFLAYCIGLEDTFEWVKLNPITLFVIFPTETIVETFNAKKAAEGKKNVDKHNNKRLKGKDPGKKLIRNLTDDEDECVDQYKSLTFKATGKTRVKHKVNSSNMTSFRLSSLILLHNRVARKKKKAMMKKVMVKKAIIPKKMLMTVITMKRRIEESSSCNHYL